MKYIKVICILSFTSAVQLIKCVPELTRCMRTFKLTRSESNEVLRLHCWCLMSEHILTLDPEEPKMEGHKGSTRLDKRRLLLLEVADHWNVPMIAWRSANPSFSRRKRGWRQSCSRKTRILNTGALSVFYELHYFIAVKVIEKISSTVTEKIELGVNCCAPVAL